MSNSQALTISAASDRAELLVAAIEEYQTALEQGDPIDRADFLRRHASIARELQDCLDNIDLLRNLAPRLHVETANEQPTNRTDAAGGSQLGDFRILRELGRGGMGVVYEAEQLSIGRRVALKVLPFAAMLDKQQLNRFRNEARAAGTLDHPNIVAVHSVGTDRGVHYYAMQLIEGQSLAEVIAAMRRERGTVERRGARSEDRGTRSEDRGTRSEDRGTRSEDRGTRSEERETRSEERGARNEERGASSVGSLPLPPGEGRGEGVLISPFPTPNSPLATDTAPVAHAPTTPDTSLLAPRSSLPAFSSREYYRAVAQLGIQAAEALDHAHQNGILHRDIKPANLLLECTHLAERDDYSLKLWVTDFGLARIEQDAGLTMTGDILGTLRYMSPEQALAKRVVVDHRSDIYSLGVTLYELLTLQPAYTADDRQELLRQIAFEEPRKPRQINPHIPQDLETIVMKAIEKNPADRYVTSQEFANDLRRFVAGEPVMARPATIRQRIAKWSRRHRPLVASLAASTALIIVAVLLILSVTNARIRREAAAKTTALAQKNAALATARRAVDEMYTGLAEAWLEQQPRLTNVQREYLEKAVAFYQEFAQEQETDPLVLNKAVESLIRVGSIRKALGKIAAAESAFGQAVKQSTDLVTKHPDKTEFRLTLVASHLELASLDRATNRIQEADAEVDRAQALLSALRDIRTSDATTRLKLGLSLDKLARELTCRQRISEAEDASCSALQVWEGLIKEFPNQNDYRIHLAEHYKNYGENVDWWGGNDKQAEAALQKAVSILHQQSPTDTQVRRSLAEAVARLGEKLSAAKHDEVGQQMFSRAKILLEGLVADFPDIAENQEQLAQLLHDLAARDLHNSKFHDAELRSSRALAIYEKLADGYPDHPAYEAMLATCHLDLALALTKQAKYDAAYRTCEHALSRPLKTELGKGSNFMWRTTVDVVEHTWQIVASVIDSDAAPQPAATSIASRSTAEPVFSTGRSDLAIEGSTAKRHLIKSVVELMQQWAPDEPQQAGVVALLSCAPVEFRDPDLALRIVQESNAAMKEQGAVQMDADHKRLLCLTLFRTGRLKQAIATVPPDDPPTQFILAMAHWQLGDWQRAQTCFEAGSGWLRDYEKLPADSRRYWHYPTPAMFRRLQAEAAVMLGMTTSSSSQGTKAAIQSDDSHK